MDIKADLWFPTVVWNYQLKEINDAEESKKICRQYLSPKHEFDPYKKN